MPDGVLTDELESLLERQDDYIDDTFEILTSQYSSVVRDATDDLREVIDDIDTGDRERLEADTSSVAQARIQTRQSFSAVEAIWERWADRLDQIQKFPSEMIGQIEGSIPRAAADDALVDQLRGLWPDGDQPGTGMAARFYNLSEHHRQQMADAVTRHVLGRARREDLIDDLASRLETSTHQAQQVFRDSTIQFSRSVNAQKSEELGYEYHQYFGPLDSITRPFCRPMVGQIFSKQEIEEMDNGQTGDVMTSGGGYGCRHRWVPVRREFMDDDEWERLRGEADQ